MLRLGNKLGALGVVSLAILLLAVLPNVLDPFRLNLVSKYLVFAVVGVGIVLMWGYCGILCFNLCSGRRKFCDNIYGWRWRWWGWK